MNRFLQFELILAGVLALTGCEDATGVNEVPSDAHDSVEALDVHEVTALALCVPECQERACGPDGCGGSCGVCPGDFSCISGQCTEFCEDGNEVYRDGCNLGQRSAFRVLAQSELSLNYMDVQAWPSRPEFLVVGTSQVEGGCMQQNAISAVSVPFSTMSAGPAIRVDSTDNREYYDLSVEQAGPENMVTLWRRSDIWCSGSYVDPVGLQAVIIKPGMNVPDDEWTVVDQPVRGYVLVGDSEGFWVQYGFGGPSEPCHRYAQRFDTEGAPVWPAIELAATDGGCNMGQTQGVGCVQADGNLLVVNEDRSPTQFYGRIISEIVGRDGTLVSGPNEIAVAPGIESYGSTSLLCLPEGRAILVFDQAPFRPAANRTLKAIALDHEGKPLSSEYALSGAQQSACGAGASLSDSGWFLTLWRDCGASDAMGLERLLMVRTDVSMGAIGDVPYAELDVAAEMSSLVAVVRMPGSDRVASFWRQSKSIGGELTAYSGLFAQTFDRYGVAPLD